MNIKNIKILSRVNTLYKARYVANKLNKTCKNLDDDYDINSGGCCYVAYLISKLLENSEFNLKLVVYDYYKNDLVNGNELNSGGSRPHYCIELNGFKINNSDFDKRGFKITKINNFKSDDLLYHYYSCKWNTTYDKHNNRIIAKKLKENFFDIEKNIYKK